MCLVWEALANGPVSEVAIRVRNAKFRVLLIGAVCGKAAHPCSKVARSGPEFGVTLDAGPL